VTGGPTLRNTLTRAAQRVVVALMAVVVLAAALFVLSVNSVFGAGWRRQVVTTARQIEPVNRLLVRSASPGPTPPPTARTPRPTPVPSLITGTPTAGSSNAGGVNVGINISALTDGQVSPRAGAWRTREGQTTADLRFAAAGTTQRAVFAHSETFPKETWAKDIELWVMPAADGAQEVRAGAWTLAQTTGEQSFPLPPAPVQGVRLRVLSNYGSREYTSLAEFALQGAE
jgi:hypothetical protein